MEQRSELPVDLSPEVDLEAALRVARSIIPLPFTSRRSRFKSLDGRSTNLTDSLSVLYSSVFSGNLIIYRVLYEASKFLLRF